MNQETAVVEAKIRPERDIFTVTRLNLEVRMALENSFPLLWVTGEISNLAQPRSGHLYFTLKDTGAQVRCALFRSRRTNLRFQPADGMQVVVRARITLFEPRGDFQLVIEHMEPAGEGALRQEVEALKARLAAEGLFNAEGKKPLPSFPRRIGVLTSPSGAAVRDVLSVLGRRWPVAEVLIFPIPVQGATAAAEIRRMLAAADRGGRCDVLILTRGGGSLEDLMAFNDEGLVRAIHACTTPLVSAIGHEIDFTLADFAADRRAPTPSAAAELVSPDGREIAQRFASLSAQLGRALASRLRHQEMRARSLEARLAQYHPGRRLQQQQQRLDELQQRLERRVRLELRVRRQRLAHAGARLTAQAPSRQLARHQDQLRALTERLAPAISRRLLHLRERAGAVSRQLHTVSPLATLGRGYAIVRRPDDGSVITRASDTAVGEVVESLLAEGSLLCRVEALGEGPDGAQS